MDEIQKVLVKAGRKDLAQKYYQKVAVETKDLYDDMIEEMLNATWKIARTYHYDTHNIPNQPSSVTNALEKAFPKPVADDNSGYKIELYK